MASRSGHTQSIETILLRWRNDQLCMFQDIYCQHQEKRNNKVDHCTRRVSRKHCFLVLKALKIVSVSFLLWTHTHKRFPAKMQTISVISHVRFCALHFCQRSSHKFEESGILNHIFQPGFCNISIKIWWQLAVFNQMWSNHIHTVLRKSFKSDKLINKKDTHTANNNLTHCSINYLEKLRIWKFSGALKMINCIKKKRSPHQLLVQWENIIQEFMNQN